MPLNRSWVYPANTVTTETPVAVTASVAATGGQGFSLSADFVSTPVFVTAPATGAASVYAPASYTAGAASVATVIQNTLGYDAVYTAYFQGSCSVASFQVGVSSTNPPLPVTVATGISSTTTASYDFPLYVPSGYFMSFQAFQANGASVPSSALTIVATPV